MPSDLLRQGGHGPEVRIGLGQRRIQVGDGLPRLFMSKLDWKLPIRKGLTEGRPDAELGPGPLLRAA